VTTTRSCDRRLRAIDRAELVSDGELKVYPGAPHGLFATHTDQLNADLLAFVKR